MMVVMVMVLVLCGCNDLGNGVGQEYEHHEFLCSLMQVVCSACAGLHTNYLAACHGQQRIWHPPVPLQMEFSI